MPVSPNLLMDIHSEGLNLDKLNALQRDQTAETPSILYIN